MSNIKVINEYLYFSIVFDKKEINAENVKLWFEEMVYFTPDSMSGTYLTKNMIKKYSQKAFYASIQKDIKNSEKFHFSIFDESKNLFKVMQSDYYGVILASLEKSKFNEVNNALIKRINGFFTSHNGVVAYACSGKDNFFQNLEDPAQYKNYGRSTNGLPLIKSRINPNWTEVDTECFPGHKHNVHDLWFGSCWAMWFGEAYFKHISKEILSRWNNCYENIGLDNISIRILLYENVWDYDKPENRERQWSFRRQVGIDEVAHRLIGTNA